MKETSMSRLEAMETVLNNSTELFIQGNIPASKEKAQNFIEEWKEKYSHAINSKIGILQIISGVMVALEDYGNGYKGVLLSNAKCDTKMGKVILI